MAAIKCTLRLEPQYKIKAKLPRKLKKDIIKVSGRDAYRELVANMEYYYSIYGYCKFKIKRVK